MEVRKGCPEEEIPGSRDARRWSDSQEDSWDAVSCSTWRVWVQCLRYVPEPKPKETQRPGMHPLLSHRPRSWGLFLCDMAAQI